MMKELTLGTKTGKELADWAGISYGSFRNKKEKFLQDELPYYAEFHLNAAGKVVIDNILDAVYDKSKLSSASIIMKEVPKKWNKNMLDTSSNVGRKIQKEFKEKDPNGKIANLAPATVNNYAGKGRTYYFGSPIFQTPGIWGETKYQWAKKIYDENGEPDIVFLTPAELKIKDELVKKYYGNTQDQMLFIMEAINSGAATPAQVGEALGEVAAKHKKNDTYRKMINELNERLDCTIIRASQVYLNEEGVEEMKLIELQEEE